MQYVREYFPNDSICQEKFFKCPKKQFLTGRLYLSAIVRKFRLYMDGDIGLSSSMSRHQGEFCRRYVLNSPIVKLLSSVRR